MEDSNSALDTLWANVSTSNTHTDQCRVTVAVEGIEYNRNLSRASVAAFFPNVPALPPGSFNFSAIEHPAGSEEELLPFLVPGRSGAYAISTIACKRLRRFETEGHTVDEDIARWIIVDAYRNDNEYLAPEWPSQEMLERYFEMFDEYVFAFMLKDKVTVRSLPRGHSHIAANDVGLTSLISKDEARIYVFGDHECWDNLSLECRKEFSLGVLLHEMCHAYLGLYHCPCTSCADALGPLGHGKVWEKLATMVAVNYINVLESMPEKLSIEYLHHRRVKGDYPDLLGIITSLERNG